MPGCIKKLLQKYKHQMPKKLQNCPYTPVPKQYGAAAQTPLPTDISPKLSYAEIKEIQCIIGSISYYTRAFNITILMAISSIASKQIRGMTNTMAKAKKLFYYLAMHPDATIRFQASYMILNVHSNASYLSESNAHSRACSHFFHGMVPQGRGPNQIKWRFFYIMHHPTICCGFSGRG
jgi:hypothetical protein